MLKSLSASLWYLAVHALGGNYYSTVYLADPASKEDRPLCITKGTFTWKMKSEEGSLSKFRFAGLGCSVDHDPMMDSSVVAVQVARRW
jgi:hypothetical protein